MRAGVAHLVGTFTFFKKIWRRRFSFAAAAVDPYAGYLHYDSVTRADSTTSPGVPEKGGYHVNVGTWGVTGGGLYAVTAANGDNIEITTLFPGPDGSIEFTGRGDWYNHAPCPLIRRKDSSNSLLWAPFQGVSELYLNVAGGYTGATTDTISQLTDSQHTYKITAIGNVINMYDNGALVSTYTLTGAAATFTNVLPAGFHWANTSAAAMKFWLLKVIGL